MKRTLIVLSALLAFTACDDGPSAVDDSARMTVAFSAAGADAAAAGDFAASAASDVIVTGSNGTLTITDVAFIVGEFKLDRTESSCEDSDDDGIDDELDDDLDDDDGDDEDDDCEEFEVGDYFVQLPLTGGATQILTTSVPAGTYVEMKFETEDVDLSEAEDDDDDDAEIADILADIAAAGYDDWPDDASLVVAGSFDPIDGEPRDFVAYFDAEIRIEMPFDPPLVIDGTAGTVDIEVDPSAWFVQLDGSVIDLSAFDYATTGEVLEFEAKMDDGFTKIELEGFDDDDD